MARKNIAGRPTAEIISFPRPIPARLQRAVASLDEALAEHRAATAAWRDSVSALQGAMHSLRSSLREYDTSLVGLSNKVCTLSADSRHLEALAESILAHAGR